MSQVILISIIVLLIIIMLFTTNISSVKFVVFVLGYAVCFVTLYYIQSPYIKERWEIMDKARSSIVITQVNKPFDSVKKCVLIDYFVDTLKIDRTKVKFMYIK